MLEFMDLTGIATEATTRYNVTCNYHFHYQFELLLVRDGIVHARISGKDYTLHRGELAFSFPFEPHSYTTDGISHSVCFVFAPEIVSSFYPFIRIHNTIHNAFALDPDLFRYIERVSHTEDVTAEIGIPKISEIEKSGIISLLLSQIEQHCPAPDDAVAAENTKSGDIALKYLSQHFLEPITLESAAKELGYNKSYLSRTIKAQTGKGFAQHLIGLRIFHAAQLIELSSKAEGESSLSQIALECGFNNIRSFNRNFKMIMGETPSQYLSNHKVHTKQQ